MFGSTQRRPLATLSMHKRNWRTRALETTMPSTLSPAISQASVGRSSNSTTFGALPRCCRRAMVSTSEPAGLEHCDKIMISGSRHPAVASNPSGALQAETTSCPAPLNRDSSPATKISSLEIIASLAMACPSSNLSNLRSKSRSGRLQLSSKTGPGEAVETGDRDVREREVPERQQLVDGGVE